MRGAIRSICALSAVLACEATGPPSEELLGVWRSPAPAYANRYFEVRTDFVIFGTGKYTLDMRPLEGVWSERSAEPDSDTAFTLRYEAADLEILELRVHYAAGPPARLRFENHDEIWLREKPAVSSAREGMQ